MEHVPAGEQAAVPESALRISKCFDYFMSEAAGLRDEIDFPDGQHRINVSYEEPTVFVPVEGGSRLYGRRFSASVTTVPASGQSRAVYEAWALVDDRATDFVAKLPLADRATAVHIEELAAWDEVKRQKVLMILSVLLRGVFEATPTETE